MTYWKLASSTAAIALFSGAVYADVTPEDVWGSWQKELTASGQTMTTGSAAQDGDAFVVTDLVVTSTKDGTTTTTTIPEVTFTDQGDGTVEITMSDSYPIAFETAAVGETPASGAEITISHPGLSVIASGTPEATDYDFTAPEMKIALTKIDGADAAAEGADVSALLTNVSGGYQMQPVDEGFDLTSEFTAESMAVNVKAKNPEDGSDVVLTASVTAPVFKMDGSFIGLEGELPEALAKGFGMDIGVSYGTVSYDLSVTEAKGPTKITGGAESGSFQLAMDAARLLYSSAGKGVTLSLSGPEIPVPQVNVSWAESAATFLMPIVASEEVQDFTFLAKVIDLTLPEEIWAMGDPTGVLAHDPATVIVVTKGKVKLTTDIIDEVAMAALGDAPPGELHALDINEIKVKVAGAELTGAGAFTFDNTDMATFGGVPAPTGKLDLTLTGGNKLLDGLVTLGLLTEDDATGARMMVAMFANPGSGEDVLTSTLEFKDKHFFANGQQIQ